MLKDAYKSLIEALIHGGVANRVRVKFDWVESEAFEGDENAAATRLEGVHGILVPGGFGERGAEGKIRAAKFARERKVPDFGARATGSRQGSTLQGPILWLNTEKRYRCEDLGSSPVN